MSRTVRFSLALGLVFAWAGNNIAKADTGASAFKWSFSDVVSTSLTQCQEYNIKIIELNNSMGVAPYYMIAWPANGIPTTSYIGNDSNNLQWTNNQPAGSKLILAVADSVGNSGGEPVYLFDVNGSDDSCIPQPTNTDLRVVSNVSSSDTLGPCQQLGLRVYGGTAPYNISIATVDSPVVTNFTIGVGNDVATWINRADPSHQLIVSVSDSTGVWGNTTGIITTSSDAGRIQQDCDGLATTQGNSANVDQNPVQASTGISTGSLVAAILVPIIMSALIGGAIFFWWRRRKQKKVDEPALMPDAWTGPVNDPYTPNMSYRDSQPFSPYASTPTAGESKLARYRDEANATRSPSYQYGHSPYSRDGSSYGGEASAGIGMTLLTPPIDGYSRPTSSSGSQTKSLYVPNQHYAGEGDIVIQHRDGGAAIQEIPPPYLDHNAVAGPSGINSHYPESSNAAGPSGSGASGSTSVRPSDQSTSSSGLLG